MSLNTIQAAKVVSFPPDSDEGSQIRLPKNTHRRGNLRVTKNNKNMPFDVKAKPGEVVKTEGLAKIDKITQMKVVAELYKSDISRVPSKKSHDRNWLLARTTSRDY